ncbi:MAG: nucleotidyltransferase family protein [Thermodesulfobacteriota bacterium]
MTSLPADHKHDFSTKRLNVSALADVRNLVLDLAAENSLETHCCTCWGSEHRHVVLSHHVAPWLHQYSTLLASRGLPSEFLDELKKTYTQSLMAGLTREAGLRKLVPCFSGKNVPFILLKGLYLQERVYGDPALRPMSDVDVLVRVEDFSKAQRVLDEHGFCPLVTWGSAYPELFRTVLPYGKPSSFLPSVDLHQRIRLLDCYFLDDDVVWDHASEASMHGMKVLFLSPEMNFIHIGMHALTHGPLVRDYLDLALMTRKISLDWEELLALAERLGVERPLYWLLRDLCEGGQVRIPDTVTSEVAAKQPRWIEDRLISSRYSKFWRLAARLALLDGWAPRLRYIGSTALSRLTG